MASAASDIDIIVTEGRVTLQGSVPSLSQMVQAEHIVRYLPGVDNIHNHLAVKGRN
jgi:osmotically-inducible protein OsmY